MTFAQQTCGYKDDGDSILLKHDKFNGILVDNCKKLGGRWNNDRRCWEFSKFVNIEKVKKLHSLFNENLIDIEIVAKEDINMKWETQIYFFGYKIVEHGFNEDFVKVGDKITLISGDILSKKYGKENSKISKGAVFKLSISKKILKDYHDKFKKYGSFITDNEKWDIKF